MKLYLSIIGIAMALISAVNIAVGTASWYYVITATVWCTVFDFAIDALVAIIIKKTPDRWYGVDNRLYRVTEAEKRLYNALRVKLWKDKVWELGGVGGFSKKTLKEPSNPKYIEQFIIECNKGVLTHRFTYVVGFTVMLTVRGVCTLTIALPVAIVNLFLNILPTMVLRYNTPKLKALLVRLRRKEKNAAARASSAEIPSRV